MCEEYLKALIKVSTSLPIVRVEGTANDNVRDCLEAAML